MIWNLIIISSKKKKSQEEALKHPTLFKKIAQASCWECVSHQRILRDGFNSIAFSGGLHSEVSCFNTGRRLEQAVCGRLFQIVFSLKTYFLPNAVLKIKCLASTHWISWKFIGHLLSINRPGQWFLPCFRARGGTLWIFVPLPPLIVAPYNRALNCEPSTELRAVYLLNHVIF